MTAVLTFSVATPARNALPGLRRCVGSVRRQAPAVVEHLVQDGASTDGTADWLKTQPGLTSVSEPDRGMYDAIAKAWPRSRGEILSWLNADEQYLPGSLTRVADAFAAHPDADAVFGDAILCDAATGRPLAARREIPLRRFYLRHGPLYALTCTLFFRRRLLERGLLTFDPAWRIVADADLVLRLLDAGVRFHHVHAYLALFGVGSGNQSTSPAGQEETARFHSRHSPGAVARGLARCLRVAEKAMRGCYRAASVDYEFCTDETGHSVPVHADRLTSRWQWTTPA